MNLRLLGLGNLVCGLLGVALHWRGARLALSAGIDLRNSLGVLAVLFFAIFAASGVAMLAGSAHSASSSRKLALGLVLITGLDAVGTYLLAVSAPSTELARAGYFLLGASLLVGVIWPLALVAALSTARRTENVTAAHELPRDEAGS